MKPLATFLASWVLVPAAFAGPLVDIAAEASRPAPNDMARATVFAEASGSTPKALASNVNTLIAGAARTAKGYAKVKTQSGNTSTYPVYGKAGKIDSWRMRSELVLESRDTEALSELVGKLQGDLGVAGVQFLPAPETQKQAEDLAIKDAIAAFQARARLVAETMGKPYKIKQLNISTQGQIHPPVMFRGKAAPMMAEAAPMPMEAGDSQVQVSVSGQIELGD